MDITISDILKELTIADVLQASLCVIVVSIGFAIYDHWKNR